jgi:two-component system nitrate/nitrite response regulator NarL
MALCTETIIIEPHLLVREALDSLIKKYRYRVVCSVKSTADIDSQSMVGDGPKLVILGAQSADNAVTEAVRIRELWSDSKIVLLFECACLADWQKLLTSEIDGCLPLFVSPQTLIRTLDLIMIEEARIMVTAGTRRPSTQSAQADDSFQLQVGVDEPPSCSTKHEGLPIVMDAVQRAWPIANSFATSHLNWQNRDTLPVPALGNRPRLSEREAQVLDGLVKGYANKVIARSCDLTEATVKVHMKSILRKIQVVNRTQAAVWALEHGHSVHQIKDAR